MPTRLRQTQTPTNMTARLVGNQAEAEEGAHQRPLQTMLAALRASMHGLSSTPAMIALRASTVHLSRQPHYHALKATIVTRERLSATFVKQAKRAQLLTRASESTAQQASGQSPVVSCAIQCLLVCLWATQIRGLE